MNLAAQKVLIVGANPGSSARLSRIDDEFNKIQEQLSEKTTYRGKFECIFLRGANLESFLGAMLIHRPRIVHFSGHGEGMDGLVLNDGENVGRSQVANTQGLANLFSQFSSTLDCVVLNACNSHIQAKAIAQHVPLVIGMNKSIEDDFAVHFSTAFYNALGKGEQIPRAFKIAQGYLDVKFAGSRSVPILIENQSAKEVRGTSYTPNAGTAGLNDSSEDKKESFYEQLRNSLQHRNWELADQVTAQLMTQIAKGEREAEAISQQTSDALGSVLAGAATYAFKGIVSSATKPINKLPYDDLKRIDGMWLKYSDGSFGFSVQKRILFECGAKINGRYPGDPIWHSFGEKVGWQSSSKWQRGRKLNYKTSAPEGHLPSYEWSRNFLSGDWGWIDAVAGVYSSGLYLAGKAAYLQYRKLKFPFSECGPTFATFYHKISTFNM